MSAENMSEEPIEEFGDMFPTEKRFDNGSNTPLYSEHTHGVIIRDPGNPTDGWTLFVDADPFHEGELSWRLQQDDNPIQKRGNESLDLGMVKLALEQLHRGHNIASSIEISGPSVVVQTQNGEVRYKISELRHTLGGSVSLGRQKEQ